MLGLIATGSITLALTKPALATWVNALAVAAYLMLGTVDGPTLILAPLTAFVSGLVLRPSRHVRALTAAIVLVGAGTMLRTAIHLTPDWRETTWQLVGTTALLAGAAAVAWWIAGWQTTQFERRRRAVSEERLRMAQDLHDHVGHGLAVIAMQAGVGLHVLASNPDAARRALEAIRDTSRLSLDSLRGQLGLLTGTPPEAPTAPQPGLDQVPALADRVRAAGLAVDVRMSGVGALPPDVDAAAYLIVQEAATNALRHANAARLQITIRRIADTVDIEVRDDGEGATVGPGDGLGLRSMADRAAAPGGTLTAGPAPASGFVLHAVLPLDAVAEERTG